MLEIYSKLDWPGCQLPRDSSSLQIAPVCELSFSSIGPSHCRNDAVKRATNSVALINTHVCSRCSLIQKGSTLTALIARDAA